MHIVARALAHAYARACHTQTQIAALANGLIYFHRLRCGSEAVARRRLPHPTSAPDAAAPPAWLAAATCRDRPVVFLDTGAADPGEGRSGGISGGTQSATEAAVAVAVAEALVRRGGLHQAEVGIIAPYRAQIQAIIKQVLSQREHPTSAN